MFGRVTGFFIRRPCPQSGHNLADVATEDHLLRMILMLLTVGGYDVARLG